MSYTNDRDGYAIEPAFADGTTIDGAGDDAFLLGMLASRNDWPSPEFAVIHSATGVNAREVTAGEIYKDRAELRGMLTLMMQNGVPIWLAMGASSTVDADPIFTHTITPTTDGSLLPSIVLQHEERGSGTNEEYQFQGVKVDSLLLYHNLKGDDMLMAKLEIMASKPIDPAFALTNDPALPSVANADPFMSLTRTWDYGSGNLALDGLEQVEIVIANGLDPKFGTSYDTNVYTGQWAYMFQEAERKQYQINISFHPSTIERALWDESVALANTKELYFKWTRGTNDYIEVTATDCQVKHQQIISEYGKLKVINAVIVPRALSFTVKDGVAGIPHYGES